MKPITGLLTETIADLKLADIIPVVHPDVEHAEARVVSSHESKFGCDFLTPFSNQIVSASLLQSSFEGPDPALEELPVGTNPSTGDMGGWISEFDKTKHASGSQLIGFRRASDGLIIAMVARTN
jgi:hypothetical protein